MQIELKNKKTMTVRKPNKDDAKKLIEYLNRVGGESDNLLFGENEFLLTVEQEEEYIEKMSNSKNDLMIIALDEEEIVSCAQIVSSNRHRIAHNGEVSISVRKDYWNMGIGREMFNCIINHAKQNETILNVCLGVNSNNLAAIHLYKQFGFEVVGRHKRNFKVNGEFIDELLMDLYL